MGIYIEGLDKQVQKGAESITVTFWDKDELIINEYDIGDMSKVTDLDIVRCGECKWKDECILGSYGVSEQGFCYKGERRADEKTM